MRAKTYAPIIAVLATGLVVYSSPLSAQAVSPHPLFDGETLTGWEGDTTVFRVKDGAIYGGTSTGLDNSKYPCTTRVYGDFELSVEARLEGPQDVANGGVLFRSARKAGSTLVAGYQPDMGFVPGGVLASIANDLPVDEEGKHPLWGVLLDEFRDDAFRYPDEIRARLLAAPDRTGILEALEPDGWNEIIILAVGPRIELMLNGVRTAAFVEDQPVLTEGLICVQAHSGEPSQAVYRNVTIRTGRPFR